MRARGRGILLGALLGALAAVAGAVPPGAAAASPSEPPAWSRDAVLYGAVVERFGPGGDFDSVRARLDYLRGLGIDAIWLSPVNATVPDDFGYAVTGYRRLRESYGTKADFRRLVDAAHARGIRVIMDFVPNHTSRQHPWFQHALNHGPGSRFWDFYERDRQGRPKHFFDWNLLPNLNYSNPEVRRRIIGAGRYWVRNFGVDGYRVDVAWGVRRRAPGFWPRFSRAVERVDPNALLLAEASARRRWYSRHGFDAAYDWTGELGRGAWTELFDDPERTGARLARALRATPSGAGRSLVLRFLDNNDTGERFAVRHGAATARLAAVLELTVPGMPLIYTGQETGADYDPYSLAEPLPFEDRLGLRPHYARLIALRRELPALAGGEIRLAGRGPASTIAYARPPRAGGEPVLVAINFGDAGARVPLDPGAVAGLMGRPLSDRLGGGEVTLAAGAPALELPPRTALVLAPAA